MKTCGSLEPFVCPNQTVQSIQIILSSHTMFTHSTERWAFINKKDTKAEQDMQHCNEDLRFSGALCLPHPYSSVNPDYPLVSHHVYSQHRETCGSLEPFVCPNQTVQSIQIILSSYTMFTHSTERWALINKKDTKAEQDMQHCNEDLRFSGALCLPQPYSSVNPDYPLVSHHVYSQHREICGPLEPFVCPNHTVQSIQIILSSHTMFTHSTERRPLLTRRTQKQNRTCNTVMKTCGSLEPFVCPNHTVQSIQIILSSHTMFTHSTERRALINKKDTKAEQDM
ncbi:hypothetical protein J6590_028954 [Homalodisca vitripennis]|nr:hypothetical protein J6590_028954 [Homalodisca vitripennis]